MTNHVEVLREMFAVCANERRMKEADALDAAISALSPPSSATPGEWVMVPRKITEAMCDACHDVPTGIAGSPPHPQWVWDAMLAAAPQPQERAGSDAGAVREFVMCRCYDETAKRLCADRDRCLRAVAQSATHPQPASDASGDADLIDSLWQVAESYTDCRIKRDILRAAERLATLSRALAESRGEAARYRWLRDDTDGDDTPEYGVFRCVGAYPTGEMMLWGHDLDAAIDAARAVAAQQQEGQ